MTTLVNRFKTWWQLQTGEEETPLDGDTPAWAVSMVFHLVMLVLVAFLPSVWHEEDSQVSLTVPQEVEDEEAIELPEEVFFSEAPQEKVGANSVNGDEVAQSLAPTLSDISEIPNPMEVDNFENAEIQINNMVEVATGLAVDNLPVKGAVGEGTTGAVGAIDRITHEILLSLEERRTLVVWLFDQSGSLTRQRTEIHDRFDRIYEELGVLQAAGNDAFKKHEDKPLLTSIVEFGKTAELLLDKTDSLEEIKKAVDNIEQDKSGFEKVFSAVYMAAERYRFLRVPDPKTGEPERNVMFVVFTDEVGDDRQGGLEPTINICRRYEMPVYVVGVPAPFGRDETLVKWVDPDPNFDQTPQWGQVSQGPESFLPERIKLNFVGDDELKNPIDSGFGPFALTRLAYETGGIYFAVHPNRNVSREVSRRETAEFSAHISQFFDPTVMKRYRPDYVSEKEYMRRVSSNKCRAALVQTAAMSWISPMDKPETRFVKRSEANLANDLSEAQKAAAKLEPKLEQLYQTIRLGESDRPKETQPRWQAGFDLAIGRIMAAKVRTEVYNAMLAEVKRGKKFENDKSNTWVLKPADLVTVGSQLDNMAKKAKMYLSRVVEEHAGTPWAALAEKELATPIGWQWTEEHTDLSPQRNGMGGNNNNNPNDELNMLKKRPPKRRLPKL